MSVFSDKVIITVLMKYLSPISFSTLKESVPDFYRCWVVKNTSFMEFFKQKLLTNLIIYFGQNKQSVKIANMIMSSLHNYNHRRILTGSFLLYTLNGDNINECNDIDIITNVYDTFEDSNTIRNNPLTVFNVYDINFGSKIETDFVDPPGLGYTIDDSLRDILNMKIDGKKIQFLNIKEKDQIEYIKKFDLPICKNAYYNNTLKVSHFSSILSRSFNMNVSRTYFPRVVISNVPFVHDSLCPSIYKRLVKYKNRLYNIYVYTDRNVDNINVKSGLLDVNDSNTISNDLEIIIQHECDVKCIGFIKPDCCLSNLCNYVLKREIMAVWRYFWYNHTNDDLVLINNNDKCCKSPEIKKRKNLFGFETIRDDDDEVVSFLGLSKL